MINSTRSALSGTPKMKTLRSGKPIRAATKPGADSSSSPQNGGLSADRSSKTRVNWLSPKISTRPDRKPAAPISKPSKLEVEEDGKKAKEKSKEKAKALDEGKEAQRLSIMVGAAAAERCPTDIVAEEILPRIPVNCLMKNFILVCREWLQLISSPRFTHIHLNQRRPRLLLTVDDNGFVVYEDHRNDDISSSSSIIPFPPHCSNTSIRILGSCDGLIFFLILQSDELFLINPSTRNYAAARTLRTEVSLHISWFGRHPSTGGYALVFLDPVLIEPVQVYDLNSLYLYYIPIDHHQGIKDDDWYMTWNYNGLQGRGAMLHGALHWGVYCLQSLERSVFACDLRKNQSLEIPCPASFHQLYSLEDVNDDCFLLSFHSELWMSVCLRFARGDKCLSYGL